MGQRRHTVDRLVREAESQGCTAAYNGPKVRIKCPNGAVISIHASPTDKDAQLNVLRQKFAREGITITVR